MYSVYTYCKYQAGRKRVLFVANTYRITIPRNKTNAGHQSAQQTGVMPPKLPLNKNQSSEIKCQTFSNLIETWTWEEVVLPRRISTSRRPVRWHWYSPAFLLGPISSSCRRLENEFQKLEIHISWEYIKQFEIFRIYYTLRHWECQEKKNVRLAPSMNLSSMTVPDYGKMCPNF